ncbi:glycosyltransferase family 4 protein [Lacibacter sp. H375]|uniref:glycosyltransferase family 4 protein n=1 Tax=Lacibacter sp. H375 TaxID=3133424 RepID=UPI0030BE9B07
MNVNKPLIVWQAHEGNSSGANIALLEYIDVLSAEYRFHVLLPHNGSMEDALAKRSIACSIVPQYGWAGETKGSLLLQLKRFVRTAVAVQQVKELLKHLRPAFVFTNTLIPFASAKAAYKMNVPHVWWIHEFGKEDFGFRIGWGNDDEAYKKMTNWSKLVICNSNAVMDKFKPLLPAVQVERIYQPVSWKQDVSIVTKKKIATYLMFGQITESKGHEEVLGAILEAKKRMVHVSLHIKGPCESKAYLLRLQNFIEANSLGRQVQIETGYFVKEEVMPLYEVLIVASRSEAFGRVIVEANKAGLSVLVKNSGGAPELVNNSNGLLYNSKEELCSIFMSKQWVARYPIQINYAEREETERLKQLLAAIV